MKTAFITGASSGIGLELAKLFAKDGINLLLLARNEQKMNEIKANFEQNYNIKVDVLALDLSRSESISKIEDYVAERNLQIDFLVNNAGFGDIGKFMERDFEKYREMISLNIAALTELTHIFAKKMMLQNAGKILNVASIAALQPVPSMAVYGATKAFVLSFSEALSYELRQTKITVTAVLPGATATNFFNRAGRIDARMTAMSMSSEKVAAIACRAMQKGKRKVIAGCSNKLMGFWAKILPINNLTLGIIEKFTESKQA